MTTAIFHSVTNVLFLSLSLGLASCTVYKLVQNWFNFLPRQRLHYGALFVWAYASTQRGVALVFFHQGQLTPAAIPAFIGMLMLFGAIVQPIDTRLQSQPWHEALKQQEPDNADKYLAILAQSATTLRNLPEPRTLEH